MNIRLAAGTGSPETGGEGIAALVLAAAASFAVAFWLLRRARRLPEQAATGADVAHVS